MLIDRVCGEHDDEHRRMLIVRCGEPAAPRRMLIVRSGEHRGMLIVASRAAMRVASWHAHRSQPRRDE